MNTKLQSQVLGLWTQLHNVAIWCGTFQIIKQPDGGTCHIAECLTLLVCEETVVYFKSNDLLHSMKAKKMKMKNYLKGGN